MTELLTRQTTVRGTGTWDSLQHPTGGSFTPRTYRRPHGLCKAFYMPYNIAAAKRSRGTAEPPRLERSTGTMPAADLITDTVLGTPLVIPQGVSNKSANAAVCSEFIDLIEFLPNHDASSSSSFDASVDDSGNIQFHSRKSRHSILDNFLAGLRAWNVYENLVLKKKTDMYRKLATYRRLKQDCDRKYKWTDVYSYDVKFGTKLASSHDKFLYEKVDVELFVTTLDATAIKQGSLSCFRCRSMDQKVQTCLFPPHETPQEKAPKLQMCTWYHQGQEGCNNWQYGNCSYRTCHRVHVCRGCRGPEPFSRCEACNRFGWKGEHQVKAPMQQHFIIAD